MPENHSWIFSFAFFFLSTVFQRLARQNQVKILNITQKYSFFFFSFSYLWLDNYWLPSFILLKMYCLFLKKPKTFIKHENLYLISSCFSLIYLTCKYLEFFLFWNFPWVFNFLPSNCWLLKCWAQHLLWTNKKSKTWCQGLLDLFNHYEWKRRQILIKTS